MPQPSKADWKDSFKKKQVGVSDMTLLSKVHNDTINDNLEKRFHNGDIYTYIGHVLISVNPFRDLGIYTEQILRSYTGKNRLEVPPHVYAIAEAAYHNMVSYKENQCVIISGESGAGKTEAAKKIMEYIATVSGEESSSIREIKDMVLATNPLLESFGCAKTLRNNNSSRHGKYLEIKFNHLGEPVGANITNYLLEKGRIVTQIENERNFHIFYQFCKSASDHYKETFGVAGPENFFYTAQSGCLEVDGIDDVADYQETLRAMNIVGLSQEEQDNIHRTLSAILWIGNAQFQEGDDGKAFISDPNVTQFIAYLLEVDPELLNKAMTSRIIETKRGGLRGSVYEVPLNQTQAIAVRDALAKALYDRMFEWIVTRINLAMKERTKSDFVIGVLDIYGFEIFDHNSFEQLCINYVNEKLQQIFIELTLKAEQEEYVREQIKWTPINFFNNKIVCDLIEEKRPPGIFAAMNDACATAHADSQAADQSFIQRLSMCSHNPHFEPRGAQFVIKHYAGDVIYDTSGMTDKNKDQLLKDLMDLIQTTGNAYLADLFPEELNKDSKKRPPTASDKIKFSAGALVNNLMQAQPSYIRCIKPNSNKSPKEFDQKMVLHQVKYLGLCENIRVRRAGFAYRQTFEKFVERFYLLSGKTSYAGEYIWQGDAKTGTERILRDTGIVPEEWQLGVTKAFIRHPETLWALEHLRERYWHNMAIRIQRAFRNYLQYKHECATRIQRCFRKNKDQIAFVQLRDYGHQVLAGRKERRRFSLLSMRRFMGDYLGVGGKGAGGEALKNACGLGSEQVVFSCKIQLLAPRPLRSSKPSPRSFVMTASAIYIVMTVVERKLATMKLERKVGLNSVKDINMSNLRDDWMVINVQGEPSLVFSADFKTELTTHLLQRTNGRIMVNISQQCEYLNKSCKPGTLKFNKDPSIRGDAVYKNHVVSVGEGEPANSVSMPPCKKMEVAVRPITTGKLLRKGGPSQSKPIPQSRPLPQEQNRFPDRSAAQPRMSAQPVQAAQQPVSPIAQPKIVPQPVQQPINPIAEAVANRAVPTRPTRANPPPAPAPPPPPSKPRYKAIYDFNTGGDGEMGLRKDEIMEILEKDENGWWLAKKDDGREGWVPSNYLVEVEEVKPVAPPSRPKPQAKPPSPVANVQEEVHQYSPPVSHASQANTSSAVPSWKAELAARNASRAATRTSPSLGEDPVPSQRPGAQNPVIPSRPGVPTASSRPFIAPKPGTLNGNSNVARLASVLAQGPVGQPRKE
ncbi:myosin 1 [Basidiobolus meristosporus CBS 931.73]|uniref:Myosin 1 n=1 Tax=Basidiobolus meristosporus CBS 931.73 TaxID=1314790 RepID=A0A1Y1YAC1_9FUNG|nr:myosin 1 [Basidiobolus meristosporus CBS 931.73]|eukprot:ORX94706.1 myosin 1 [Basidiobolus meristosporus CBS 931.73]